jgi:hypothetical protein
VKRGVWLASIVALAACGAPSHPRRIPGALAESPAGIDRSVLEREVDVELALAARACACTDLACLDQVEVDVRDHRRTRTEKSWVTGVEPRPADLRDLGRAAEHRRLACTQNLGAWSFAWGVSDVRNATEVRDAACACEDPACTHRMDDVVIRFRAAQISLALPGSADRTEWDRLAVETDACLNEGMAREMLAKLVALRDRGCGCDDAECIASVVADFQQWNADAAGVSATAEVTPETVQGLATELDACLQP